MPWWKKKSPRQEDGQSHIPGWPSTSAWAPVAQILNQLTPPVSWDAEMAGFGGATPMAVSKCLQLMGIEKGAGQKTVGGLGWVLLTALRSVWEQLEASQRKVQQQLEDIAALKDQQAILKEVLESARGREELAKERAATMAIRFAKMKHPKRVRKKCIPNPRKVRALIASREWDPKTWSGDIWDSSDEESEWTEGEDEGNEEEWVAEARPLVTNKSKGPPGNPQAAQATRIVRDYTQQELAEMAKTNRQKPGEGLSQWLVRLWDQGTTSLYLTGEELVKLGTLSRDTLVNQFLRMPNLGATGSLFQWCVEAVYARYPAPMDWEEQPGPWQTIEEAIEQLRGMALQAGIYQQGFQGPESQRLTAGMRARLLKGAPSHMRGPLLALLGPAQGRPVGEVALLIGQLGEAERENVAKPRARIAQEKGKSGTDKKSFTRTDKTSSTPKVTRKQMFLELLEAGVRKEDIDGIPTAEMYNLWKQKCAGKIKKEGTGPRVRGTVTPTAPPPESLYPSLSEHRWEIPQPTG